MKVTIKNKSRREIPEELADTIKTCKLDEINRIAEEYNLKVIEYSRELENAKVTEEIFVIGDIDGSF